MDNANPGNPDRRGADLDGKVILVVGASSGIGKETALLAGRYGATVVIGARREAACATLAEEIDGAGSCASYGRIDLLDPPSIDRFVYNALAVHGRIDGAINMAGVIGKFGSLAEADPDDWDITMGTNLKGVWLAMRAQAAAMRGGGVIVNVSSWMADGGMEMTAPYTASKAGLQGMSRSLAVELAPSGVRVNVVAPGAVMTEMAEQFGEGVLAPFRDHTPLGRLARPRDVAEAILWLCSDAAAFVTGQTIGVDGGYSIAGHRGFFG